MAEKGQTTNVKDYVLANAEDYPVLAARMWEEEHSDWWER
jgi:hypothetical protein